MDRARGGSDALPRAVIPIYGTTLVDTLGYTLLIPLLPLLVRQYHASDVIGGALLSIPAFCSAIAAPVWGKLSDRLGRKSIIMASQVLSLAGYLLLALSHMLLFAILARVISGLGGGSLGAAESFIADVTEPDQRERAYSLYGAVFGAAFVIGPVASGVLLKYGVALPFFVAAFLEALNLVFTGFFLPQQPKPQKKTSILQSLRAASALGVRSVLIRQFLFIFAVVSYLSNFALYADHVLRMDASRTSYLLAVAAVLGAITLLFVVTPLAKRIGENALLQIGLAMSVLAYVGLIFVSREWTFLGAMSLWAIGAAIAQPTLTTVLSDRVKGEERGAILGISDSVSSIAMILGPTAGAALVGGNPRMLCVLPAVASATAFALGRLLPARKDIAVL